MNKLIWLSLILANVHAGFGNLYKAEPAVVFVEVKKRSYPGFKEARHGIIIGEDGYILINNSLLGESQEAVVTLNDGSSYKAIVIGRDLKTDLAVLKIDVQKSDKNNVIQKIGKKIDSQKLSKVTWAEGVVKGQNIFVISSTYNMKFSLFQTIISNDNSHSKMLGEVKSCVGNACEMFVSPLLQYSVNAPAKDGILFDEDGKCVGINTNLFSSLGIYGISFAIPSIVAKKVAQDLILNGKVTRSFIGVELQKIDSKLFAANKMEKIPLKEARNLFGCVIVDIKKDSPSDLAKLQAGDIIVNVDGQLVTDLEMFQDEIISKAPGSKIILDIWRKIDNNKKVEFKKSGDSKNDTKLDIKKLGIMQAEKNINKTANLSQDVYKLLKIEIITKPIEERKPKIDLNYSKHIGVKLITINAEDKISLVSRNINKDIKNGLIVVDIADNALAKELQINDIILQIQHKNIKTLAEFDKEIIKTLKNNEKYIILLIARKEKIVSCAIEVANLKIENFEKEGR